jgi:alpha-glucosidase
VAGAKIDFFDHEAKETIDLYDAILREAAEHHVMVDFHGANKPTGMDRTWPNELTREAIYGFEHRGNAEWGPHDATVPFTRFLAGSADFTPTVFGDRRKETSVDAPGRDRRRLHVRPAGLRRPSPEPARQPGGRHPARDPLHRGTRPLVLPPSEIGEVVVMARPARVATGSWRL